MDEKIIDHALSLILDDIRIGEYVTDAVDKRLGRVLAELGHSPDQNRPP